jgi:hypothetical protein
MVLSFLSILSFVILTDGKKNEIDTTITNISGVIQN